jgi:hypothetical protein
VVMVVVVVVVVVLSAHRNLDSIGHYI